MIKYAICTLTFLIVNASVYSQRIQNSIIETGKSLDSCECIFENLFANWGSRFITNHENMKLVSWNYVETLVDTARINFYARKFGSKKSIGFQKSSRSSFNYSERKNIREFRIEPYFFTFPPETKEEEIREYRRTLEVNLKGRVKIGDKAYAIKFIYNDIEYEFDVFCRPKENIIVFDGWIGLYGITNLEE